MDQLPSDIFARRLRIERERLGMTQTDMARRVADLLDQNVDPSVVNRIEQQTRAVRLDEAEAMAQALDVPLTSLIHEEPIEELDRRIIQAMTNLEKARRVMAASRSRVTELETSLDRLQKERDALHRKQ